MIKQTFLNLSEEKRKHILSSAKKEFAENPLHKASINRIIKDLDIARGSFYNYFDNIEDLYFYVLKDFRDNMKNKLIASIQKNDGDLFKGFIAAFEYILECNKDEINSKIIRNLFLNLNSTNKSYMNPGPEMSELKEQMKMLKTLINTENLKIKNDMELMDVIQILTDNMFQNVMHYFMFNIPEKIMKEKYLKRIEIIKYGICKEEK